MPSETAAKNVNSKVVSSLIRKSDEAVGLLIQSINDAVVSADSEGRVILWNAGAERIFGFRETEMLGQPLVHLMPERYRAAHLAGLERLRTTGESRLAGRTVELHGLRRDGAEFPVELTLSTWMWQGKRYFVAIIRDISLRKELEAEIRRQKARVDMLKEIAVAANLAASIDDILEFTLNRIGEFTGWHLGHVYLPRRSPPQELVSTGIWWMEDPDRYRVFREFTEKTRIAPGEGLPGRVFESGEALSVPDFTRESWILGSRVAAEIGLRSAFAFPILAGNDVVGVMEFYSDRVHASDPELVEAISQAGALVGRVIERQYAQHAQQKITRELERSNLELQQFAYVVSHDLQEPLRAVGYSVQLLADRYGHRLAEEEAQEFLGFAREEVSRMSRMIRDLLSYSRIGARADEKTPTDCNHLIQEVLSALHISLEDCRAEVVCGPLPIVRAIPSQLSQLFQNLITNSIKFRGKRPLRIHISSRRQDAEWLFTVQDNGIGIDPTQFEEVFRVFQRVRHDRANTGTGIGLAICKKVIEAHGGRIWVGSTPGEGTTFYFTLQEEDEFLTTAGSAG